MNTARKAITCFLMLFLTVVVFAQQVDGEDLDSDTVILAKMITQEADVEPYLGKVAVAWVARNRVESSVTWWGTDYKSVIQKSYQFYSREKYSQEAYRVAEMVLAGTVPDPTDGATHFHADYVSPWWIHSLERTVKIGEHIFYRKARVA